MKKNFYTLIIIKSIDKITIKLYFLYLKKLLKNIKIKAKFVYNLPVSKKRITLLKSPHVYKTSMEQFEFKKYKLIFGFKNIKENIINFLIKNKPKNIKINIVYKK
jgi:ribosomal protein S10